MKKSIFVFLHFFVVAITLFSDVRIGSYTETNYEPITLNIFGNRSFSIERNDRLIAEGNYSVDGNDLYLTFAWSHQGFNYNSAESMRGKTIIWGINSDGSSITRGGNILRYTGQNPSSSYVPDIPERFGNPVAVYIYNYTGRSISKIKTNFYGREVEIFKYTRDNAPALNMPINYVLNDGRYVLLAFPGYEQYYLTVYDENGSYSFNVNIRTAMQKIELRR